MTTVIAVAGQKGGTGKSTLAVNLAAYWHEQGRRVLLVDADPQGTTLTWSEVAAEQGIGGPTVTALGDNLRQALPTLAESFDVAVIDLPGRVGKRQGAAMMVADLVLLPSGPSTPDVWALAESAQIVTDAQEVRPQLLAVVLLNKRANNTESRSARETLASVGLPVLQASLGQRVAFSETLAAGKGVTTYAPRDPAAAELAAVADELDEMITAAARRGLRVVR
jgi:chromosome partitioning protein